MRERFRLTINVENGMPFEYYRHNNSEYNALCISSTNSFNLVLILLSKLGQLTLRKRKIEEQARSKTVYLKLNTYLNVQLLLVALIMLHLKLAKNPLSLLACDIIPEVEGCLFPMCGSMIWSS